MNGVKINAYETVFDLEPPMTLYGMNIGAGSVFIPSVHRNVDETMLVNILANTGKVSRIDWAEMTEPKKNFRRAFVHFEMCDQVRIRETSYITYFLTINGFSNKFSLTILPAQNPVPTTELNIHQLANNLKLLEDSMWGAMNAKNEQINDLEELVDDLRTRMENQEAMIHILLKRQTYPSPPTLVRQTNKPPSFQYDGEEKLFQSNDTGYKAPSVVSCCDPKDPLPKYDLAEAVESTQDDVVPDWVSDAGTESTEDSTLPPLEPIDDVLDLDSVSSEASMPSLVSIDGAKSVSTHDSMPPLMMNNALDSFDYHYQDRVVNNMDIQEVD